MTQGASSSGARRGGGVEEERRPCGTCGALNLSTATLCWQCQASLRIPVGVGAPNRAGPYALGSTGNAIGDRRQLPDTRSRAHPIRWAVALAAVVGIAASAWILMRPHEVSLPAELDGVRRISSTERHESSPFDDHPPARVLAGAYGADPPSAPGTFGLVVWVIDEGHANGPGPIQILMVGAPPGLTFDDLREVSADVDGASFMCVPATSITRTLCAWNHGQVDGMVGTPETDLQAALAQTERIERQLGT